MPTYLHPGVYVEEIPSGSKPIEAVGTSVAAFVGYTEKGPLNDPTLVSTWDEFEKTFGGIQEIVPDEDLELQDPMGHSVYAFFQNGGSKAYIVRITEEDSAASSTGALNTGGGTPTDLVSFTAANEGEWGDELTVRFTPKGAAASATSFIFEVGTGTGDDFETLEKFTEVNFDLDDPHFIESQINDGSKLVTALVEGADDTARTTNAASAVTRLQTLLTTGTTPPESIDVSLGGGDNGSLPDQDAYDDVWAQFTKIRDINIVLLPGQVYADDGAGIIDSAIAHCEAMGSRMVVVDPPAGLELDDENAVTDLGLPTQTYCALYYPWAKVSNPFYNADTNPGAERTVLVAPSAFAAGMWAKTDGRRGVWKAPAGVETGLLGVAGLEWTVEDAEQDFLNPLGVNALRKRPGYGTVIWGTRTLSTKSNPEWRYVPVRRTAIFIEQSIFNGIQWAVFEPNDHRLWSSLRANIESFMNGLFRAGAFQGEKSGDAYFVRCGLGSTMTQDDIDRGQVIVLIGFAPVKPAEFVIVRIQQKVGQQ
jgi:phage tail sheath protein FI